MKTTIAEHGQNMFCPCSVHVLSMFCPCSVRVLSMFFACSFHGNSTNNIFSYCGLVDTRKSASEKYLPVPVVQLIKFQWLKNTTTQRWLWYPRICTSWAFLLYPNVLWPFTSYKWAKIENVVQITSVSSSELYNLCTETYRKTNGQKKIIYFFIMIFGDYSTSLGQWITFLLGNYQLSYSPYSNYLVGLKIYHPTVFPLYNCVLVKGQIMNISSQLSRLDSFLSYIHRPQWKTSLVQAVEPAQLYAPLPVAGTKAF